MPELLGDCHTKVVQSILIRRASIAYDFYRAGEAYPPGLTGTIIRYGIAAASTTGKTR